VLARHARNRRLADACQQWAFCSLTASPGARAYYDAYAPAARPTARPSDSWATGGSESSTAASPSESPTPRSSPGDPSLKRPLDYLRPWGV
jgi:hypothetical protein